jgi:hypothetical protein
MGCEMAHNTMIEPKRSKQYSPVHMRPKIVLLLALLVCVTSCNRRPRALTVEQQAIVAKYDERIKTLAGLSSAAHMMQQVILTQATNIMTEPHSPDFSERITANGGSLRDNTIAIERYAKEQWEVELTKLKYIAEHKYTQQ